MQKAPVKKILKWLKIAALFYVVAGVTLYFLQGKLLFHPKSLPEDHVYKFPALFKEINLAVSAEKNLNIVQFTVPDSLCKGIVLYFHGNRENIGRYARYATNFTKNNYEVWMIDYPGFGKSTGERSEKNIYADALDFCNMARSRFAKDSIIFYGKSIGTGVAAQLATVRDCKRLILETPYYSIEALFRHYAPIYPVGFMTRYHFPVYRYVQEVIAPVTIFHGTNDEVIPYNHSRKLADLIGAPAELVTIQKGKHNNLDDFPVFHEKLDSVLSLP